MKTPLRIALVFVAGAFTACFGFGISVFGNAVQAEETTTGQALALAGIAFAMSWILVTPLWLPALVPARFVVTRRIFRWACGLLYLMFVRQVLSHERNIYIQLLAVALAIVAFLLLRPELVILVRRLASAWTWAVREWQRPHRPAE